MAQKLFFLILLFGYNLVHSQNAKNYFQQKVDYNIDCKLNEIEHFINGTIKIIYHNQSPDVLDKIGMHLWPNAYGDKHTAFARQKLLHRSTKFFDSDFPDQGFLKIMDLHVDGKTAKLELLKGNPDMGWLLLDHVLKPKDSIVIFAKFALKIPESFSRLGHVDNSYQITQWYLKPAVYDHKGWHLMPYLDQGEFFADFGKYNVSITIPENYVVAATGVLQDSTELEFLQKKIEETKMKHSGKLEIPEPDNTLKYKTIHYVADSVHDFAWFADKRFQVNKVNVKLNSGKNISSWSFYNDLKIWPSAADFAARAIKFYSNKLGEYPWPQVTVVHSALSAGGGMEYPMITVINDMNSEELLDEVICHEVGHNWLQGVLASNERDHPWMDEGINTYYENEYMSKYYSKTSVLSRYGGKIFDKLNIKSETEVIYQTMAHENFDQHPNQTSNNFFFINYGIDVYQRTGSLFEYLRDYIGEEEMDRIMKIYFEKWKFKHPYPEDLKEIFAMNCNKNTDWLFDQVLNKDIKINYGIKKIKQGSEGNWLLTIKNKGSISAPLKIYSLKDDSIILKEWVDGFKNRHDIEIRNEGQDKIIIDYEGKYFDYSRNDNSINTKGRFKKLKPISFSVSNLWYNPLKRPVLFYPSILWNANNGIMVGVSFRRPLLPRGNWNWNLSPKYAFSSKSLAGTMALNYRLNFLDQKINFIKGGIKIKRFAFGEFSHSRTNDYTQLQPYVELDFKTNLTSLKTSRISAELFHITDRKFELSNLDSALLKRIDKNKIYKVKYYYSDPNILGPTKFISEAYFENYKTSDARSASYLRIDLEYRKSIRWGKRRYADFRIASSFYPWNTEKDRNAISTRSETNFIRGSSGAAFQNFMDYTNESNFLGRTQSQGFISQQIAIRQGGMKIAPGVAQRTNLGNSNKFMIAANVSSDLPIHRVGKFVRPYFDLALVDLQEGSKSTNQLLYSGGIQLSVIPEFLSFYFPLIHSNNIRQIYKDNGGNYFKQVCFSLNLSFDYLKDIVNFVQ